MLVGVYGKKKGVIDENINQGLTEILLQIALPFMIFASFTFSYNDTIRSNVIETFYYSFITYIIIILISKIITLPIKGEKKQILHFCNVFTNTGYIGFPLLNVIYGKEGVIYGSIFNMFFVLFLWTYGIIIFKGILNKHELKEEIIKAILNPSVIAVYLGLIIMIFEITIPYTIMSSINSIGNMTGPISMIIVGVLSTSINIKEHLKDWTIYYGIFTKIILIPGILLFILKLIDGRSIVTSSIFILAAMPAATMVSIFAEKFNMEKDYATIMVVSTTLLSIITLPIWISIIL